MSDFTGYIWYECPLCLEEENESEELDDWGEVKVIVHIDAGSPPVYYPNDRAHPGDPPTIDYYEIVAGTPCRHSDEQIHTALEDTVFNDFHEGKIETEPSEPYHPDI